MIQEQVLIAYVSEVERSKQPGYVCIYDDYGEDGFARLSDEEIADSEVPRMHRSSRFVSSTRFCGEQPFGTT